MTYEDYLKNCKESGFEPVGSREEWERFCRTAYTPTMAHRTYIFPGGQQIDFDDTKITAEEVYPFYVALSNAHMNRVLDFMILKQTMIYHLGDLSLCRQS